MEKDKWKIRRRIAVAAFISVIVIFFVSVIFAERAEKVVSIINSILFFMNSIVASYFGIVTWEDKKIREKENTLGSTIPAEQGDDNK